jgi:hypothetical protein
VKHRSEYNFKPASVRDVDSREWNKKRDGQNQNTVFPAYIERLIMCLNTELEN